MKRDDLQRKRKFTHCVLTLIASVSAFSCTVSPTSEESSHPAPQCSVYLIPSDEYSILSQNPLKVARGEDAVFSLTVEDGFSITSLSRQGQEVTTEMVTGADKVITLTLKDVRYSARYDVNIEEALYSIFYHPNGGEYLDGGDSSLPYKMSYSPRYRLRPNTELGNDRFKRDGYVLSGWNTKEDGSGERTGLGSRVTMPEDGKLDLYAVWEKETPANEFTYNVGETSAIISKYLGNDEKVVVPAQIEGKDVVRILPNTFSGNEKTVVLPPTIQNISSGAFFHSSIQELFFYDSIEGINDEAISDCADFSTIHINAIIAPRFGSKNLYSEINFADKYDFLILNKDKKKLLVFGGSGSYISINTKTIEEALNDDTVCLNMAVNGWFNGMAQFEMMLPYIKDGDTFIHSPETSSEFSFLHSVLMTPEVEGFTYNKVRLYACCESNFDLLGLVDFRDVTQLLTGFSIFNSYRKGLKETVYTDFKTKVNLYGVVYNNNLAYIDDRGNFSLPKIARSNPNEAGEADIVVEYVSEAVGHDRLNAMYDRLRGAGATVYLANAPLNTVTLQKRLDNPEEFHKSNSGKYLYYGRPPGIPDPDYPDIPTWIEAYNEAVATYLNVEVLLRPNDTLYVTDDYFEPDYHLCDEKSVEFTQLFVDALLAKRGGNA